MKIKGKYIVAFVVVLITLIGVYNYFSKPAQVKKEIPNVAVSFKPVSNQFYYDLLDEDEKEAYEQIMQQISNVGGGKVVLDKPISHFNYSRVMQTIMYDGKYGYWPYVFAFPVNQNQVLMSTLLFESDKETREKDITAIYVQIQDKTPREELKTFKGKLSEENKIENIEDFQKILETSDFDKAYYEEITNEFNNIEEDIINRMPRDLTQKEAITYFTDWIMKNIKYDYALFDDAQKSNGYDPVTEYLYETTLYAKASSEQCMIDKKAVCGGISIILSRLCNKVGIDSYVVVGNSIIDGIPVGHAWVAVNIDGNTYYTDPTLSVQTEMTYGLWTKEEMAQMRTGVPRYEFLEYFAY